MPVQTVTYSANVILPQPTRMEFQVAEYVDSSSIGGSTPWKVELQVRTITLDQYGNDVNIGPWMSVPRFKIEMVKP